MGRHGGKSSSMQSLNLWVRRFFFPLTAPVSKKYRMFRVLLAGALFVGAAIPGIARADTLAHPDRTPTLTEIHVNRSLLLPDDTLIYGLYNLPYATIPTISADQAFTFRLRSANSTTDLGDVTPFVKYDNGYNKGIISFYFLPDAPLTWGSSYTIRISENPSQFTVPISVDVPLGGGDYSTYTTQVDNQAEAATLLYGLGQMIETNHNVVLFQASGSQMVLTSEGERYFRGVIRGLQQMVPSLFLLLNVQSVIPTQNFTTTQFQTYASRFDGTWVGNAENATAQELHVPSTDVAMSLIIVVPLCILLAIFSAIRWHRTEPGLMCDALLLIMFALLGWIPIPVFASTYQGMGMFVSYLVFFARS